MDDQKTKEEKPLEWWEYVQIDLLESVLGLKEEAERFRKNPSEWRELRDKLKEHGEKK